MNKILIIIVVLICGCNSSTDVELVSYGYRVEIYGDGVYEYGPFLDEVSIDICSEHIYATYIETYSMISDMKIPMNRYDCCEQTAESLYLEVESEYLVAYLREDDTPYLCEERGGSCVWMRDSCETAMVKIQFMSGDVSGTFKPGVLLWYCVNPFPGEGYQRSLDIPNNSPYNWETEEIGTF